MTPHTTDAEMQIDPVTIFQVRHFANAAVVTDDITEGDSSSSDTYEKEKKFVISEKNLCHFSALATHQTAIKCDTGCTHV